MHCYSLFDQINAKNYEFKNIYTNNGTKFLGTGKFQKNNYTSVELVINNRNLI